MADTFVIRHKYNFTTYVPSILKGVFKNQTVTGILTYSQASKIDDVATIHEQILSLLPNGTPTSVADLTFISFMDDSNQVKVLAVEWIDINTVVEVSTGIITAYIPNASSTDVSEIRSFLAALGYTGFNIEFKNNT